MRRSKRFSRSFRARRRGFRSRRRISRSYRVSRGGIRL